MPVRDATGALIRALTAAFAGHALTFEHVHSRDWASGTLQATRHRIRAHISGPDAAHAADGFTESLEDREFDLGRYLIADIAVTDHRCDEAGVRLTIEALTIDND